MLQFGSHRFGSSAQIVQPTSNHLKRCRRAWNIFGSASGILLAFLKLSQLEDNTMECHGQPERGNMSKRKWQKATWHRRQKEAIERANNVGVTDTSPWWQTVRKSEVSETLKQWCRTVWSCGIVCIGFGFALDGLGVARRWGGVV